MAGNLPVPQGVEVKLVWTLDGNPAALNILHFRNATGLAITQTKANSMSAVVKAAFTASALAGQITTRVALAEVHVRSMVANSDAWFIGVGAAVAGTSAANPLPAATSFVITLRTGQRGRSFNGKVYLWGYTEDANDALGGMTAAGANASNDFIGVTKNNMASAENMTLALLSRWTTPAGSPPDAPPVERNPPILTDVTTNLFRDQRWDVQRRRAVPGI